MRGLELRDVTTAAGRALTQILLVGVARLTYACQHTALSSTAATLTSFFRRRERTARFWPPPRPHGTDVAEVHTAGSHSRLRSQRMMAFGTPYQHTSQAISPAPPLRQLAGKTMLLVLQLLRRKPHGGAGAMVLNVECALHLLSGGPHSCQYTGRPLCKRSRSSRVARC